MRNNNDSVFRDAPIPKAVAQMAVPTMLSMLVVVLYNMVDTFFVGQTGDANQVAAVSVATPVFLILMAFGNMFGIGGSSLISRLLGANEGERAEKGQRVLLLRLTHLGRDYDFRVPCRHAVHPVSHRHQRIHHRLCPRLPVLDFARCAIHHFR